MEESREEHMRCNITCSQEKSQESHFEYFIPIKHNCTQTADGVLELEYEPQGVMD